MKNKYLVSSIALAAIASSTLFATACGKKDSSFTLDAKQDIEETKKQAKELQEETKEIVSSINEKVEEITEKINEKTEKEDDTSTSVEETVPDSISGITPKEIESKTYNEVKQNLYEYALSDPERAKTITVEEYYGEDVCKLEYEKMKEEYSSFPASFWDEFTYDVFASESIYEECNLGYDPEADKKAYEEMQKRWAEEANSSGGGYVPGQVNNPLNGEGGTGTTWESYNSGLGEANLQ